MEVTKGAKETQVDVFSAFYPMYLVSRFVGLFPVASKLRRTGQTATYGRSRLAQAYSLLIVLTTSIVVLTSYGVISVIFAGSVSVGKDRQKIELMNKLGYVSCVIISLSDVIFSLTSSPRIRRVFLALSKADEILESSDLPKEIRPRHRLLRRISALQIALMFFVTAVCDFKDYQSFGVANPNSWILGPIYFLRFLSFCLEQQFVQVAFMFRERFVLINSFLENAFTAPGISWPQSSNRYETRGSRRDQQRQKARPSGKSKPFEYTAETIEMLRNTHAILSEEISTVNRTYELPLITDLIMLFFDFVAGGYFLASDVLGEKDANTRGLAWSWVFHSSVRIALLSWIAWEIHVKANMTGSLVVKMMKRKMDDEVKDELDVFIAQLSQNEVRINLLGLFYLDMTLPQAMTQAATSYLIILLQFQTTK